MTYGEIKKSHGKTSQLQFEKSTNIREQREIYSVTLYYLKFLMGICLLQIGGSLIGGFMVWVR